MAAEVRLDVKPDLLPVASEGGRPHAYCGDFVKVRAQPFAQGGRAAGTNLALLGCLNEPPKLLAYLRPR